MIDGFFTRPSKLKLATLQPLVPDEDQVRAAMADGGIDHLDAILVAHTHHDHAMDSATVARIYGAALVGSPSTESLAKGEGFDGTYHPLPEGTQWEIPSTRGPGQAGTGFVLKVFESKHSPEPLFPGKIDAPLAKQDRRLFAFKEGGSYTFVLQHRAGTVLVQPSANYICGRLRGVRPDVVFLSIGNLGKQDEAFARHYWRELVLATDAKLVVPIHWDDFTVPLAKQLSAMPRAFDDVERGMAVVLKLGAEFEVPVKLMPPLHAVPILPATLPAITPLAAARRAAALTQPCAQLPPG
jgi:L-ascorbate metabolism protein UlaG (beta-lactamase superfamily)